MKERAKADHVVGSLSDFPPGTHRVVEVGGRQIGVFNIRGELHALPNICPHQTGPVCEGKMLTGALAAGAETDWKLEWTLDGEVIICPWHGLEYHVPTGRCLAYSKIRLRRYEVAVRGDDVVLRMSASRGASR